MSSYEITSSDPKNAIEMRELAQQLAEQREEASSRLMDSTKFTHSFESEKLDTQSPPICYTVTSTSDQSVGTHKATTVAVYFESNLSESKNPLTLELETKVAQQNDVINQQTLKIKELEKQLQQQLEQQQLEQQQLIQQSLQDNFSQLAERLTLVASEKSRLNATVGRASQKLENFQEQRKDELADVSKTAGEIGKLLEAYSTADKNEKALLLSKVEEVIEINRKLKLQGRVANRNTSEAAANVLANKDKEIAELKQTVETQRQTVETQRQTMENQVATAKSELAVAKQKTAQAQTKAHDDQLQIQHLHTLLFEIKQHLEDKGISINLGGKLTLSDLNESTLTITAKQHHLNQLATLQETIKPLMKLPTKIKINDENLTAHLATLAKHCPTLELYKLIYRGYGENPLAFYQSDCSTSTQLKTWIDFIRLRCYSSKNTSEMRVIYAELNSAINRAINAVNKLPTQ